MSLYGRTDSNANKAKVRNTIVKNTIFNDKTIVYVDATEAQLKVNTDRGIDGPGWWSYFTYTDHAGNTRHKVEKLVALSNPDLNANETQDDDQIAADFQSLIEITTQPTNQIAFVPLGAILTIDNVGAADGDRAEGTYEIGADDYATDGDGEGATFTVVVDSDGAATVSLEDAGSGFEVGDTITISDILLGDGGAADLTFEVDSVATASATFVVVATTDPSGDPVYQWQSQAATGTRWVNISGADSDELELTELTVGDSGKKYRVKVTSTAGATEVISDTATLTVTAV
jgi:hypothetical protein